MSDLPSDFDLKFLPDWLKDSAQKNPYANFAPEEKPDRARRDGRERDRRPGHKRPSGPHPKGRREDRSPRSHDKRERKPAARIGRSEPRTEPALNIEFFPEPQLATNLGKQIKESGRAYPILQLARMFMDRPERHRIRITSKSPDVLLHQCGENASLDKALSERPAFHQLKETYYSLEVTETDPIKGNFASVARCRLSGTVLGPTNHHSYYPRLHRLFEERFSRRMSFQEFSRQIEIISDPAAVESWKEEARKVVIFRTLKEVEQLTFSSETQAEEHFRKTYLPGLVRSSVSIELSGAASRSLTDRQLLSAVRSAWEKQRGFPGQVMHHLRQQLQHSGLHWFREGSAQYLTGIRPVPFDKANQNVSENIRAIFKAIELVKNCNRASLAAALLPAESQELEKPKAALAADLHWLIHSGHIIEFADGRLILATPEKPRPQKASAQTKESAVPAGTPPQIPQTSAEENTEPVI